MSATVKLAAKLPGDFETNGLDSQAQRLIDDPKELLIAVVWLDTAKIIADVETGDQVPVARIRRIEPLGDVGDVSQAVRDLVGSAVEQRTGRNPIPFDIAEVIEGHDPDQTTIDDEL
jgi:hypothetical protein